MPEPIITLDNVRFGWSEKAAPLLDIEAFELGRGERVFLRGASGCGKSTLLALISGVLTPQSGATLVLGQSLGGLSASARDRFRADHFGIVFQQFNLIPYLSVIENVTLPCRFSAARLRKVISRSGDPVSEALRLLDHLDMAGDGLIHQPVTELSVGQQQRVAAARALIGSPEILIADEPTSSMDSDRRAAFIELLFHECDEAGTTLLFVSHDQNLQTPFDRAIEFESLNQAGTGSGPRLQVVS